MRVPVAPNLYQHLMSSVCCLLLLFSAVLVGVKYYFICCLSLNFPLDKDTEYLFVLFFSFFFGETSLHMSCPTS